MSRRQPLFAECAICRERWKVATLPLAVADLNDVARLARCPNCGERAKLFPCPTSGRGAVHEPRAGSFRRCSR